MWLLSVSKTCISCYHCDREAELRDTQTHLSTHPLLARTHAARARCHAQPFTMKQPPLPRPDSAQHAARASAQHATCSPGRATLTHSMAGVRPWCEIQSNLSSIARGANSRRVHEELEDSHATMLRHSTASEKEPASGSQSASSRPAAVYYPPR